MPKYIECGECLELISTDQLSIDNTVFCKSCNIENCIPEDDSIRGKIAISHHNKSIYNGEKNKEQKQIIFNRIWAFYAIIFNCLIASFYLKVRTNVFSSDILNSKLWNNIIPEPILIIFLIIGIFIIRFSMIEIPNYIIGRFAISPGKLIDDYVKKAQTSTWKYAVYFIIAFEIFFWINWIIEKLF